MQITFPNKTAKEIMDECKNKLGTGKFLYRIGWYENQSFFTKEKCRPRTVEVTDSIEHFGKDWNECAELVKKEGDEMLNFAESIWFLKTYYEKTEKYFGDYNWFWTSSRSSFGSLVSVGRCGADGIDVGGDDPGSSSSDLGVVFSKAVDNAYTTPNENDTTEASIKKVKNAGYMVLKQL